MVSIDSIVLAQMQNQNLLLNNSRKQNQKIILKERISKVNQQNLI